MATPDGAHDLTYRHILTHRPLLRGDERDGEDESFQ
jgi:hypothetical protein